MRKFFEILLVTFFYCALMVPLYWAQVQLKGWWYFYSFIAITIVAGIVGSVIARWVRKVMSSEQKDKTSVASKAT